MAHAGRVVSRARLMSRLSDLEDGGSENALELLVSRLRPKIAGSGVEVVTVRGVGFLVRLAQEGLGARFLAPTFLAQGHVTAKSVQGDALHVLRQRVVLG